VKNLMFALGLMAVFASTAWAQNDGSLTAPHSYDPGFFGNPSTTRPTGSASYRFDPTAHYWDYYRVDPGHGIDVDRTTPP
jgi:hypothetical protein